jgi:hypothetical protein
MSCPVCRGAKVIRLAMYYDVEPLGPTDSADIPSNAVASSKTFPCPECHVPKAPENRIAVMEARVVARSDIQDPKYEEHVRYDIAHIIARQILAAGYIKFSRGEEDRIHLSIEHRGRVGVVTTGDTKKLVQRVVEKTGDVVQLIRARAAEKMRNWGSAYTGDEGRISKGMAVGYFDEATREVLKEIVEEESE